MPQRLPLTKNTVILFDNKILSNKKLSYMKCLQLYQSHVYDTGILHYGSAFEYGLSFAKSSF